MLKNYSKVKIANNVYQKETEFAVYMLHAFFLDGSRNTIIVSSSG